MRVSVQVKVDIEHVVSGIDAAAGSHLCACNFHRATVIHSFPTTLSAACTPPTRLPL